jgi:hypothetical protein
VFSTIFHSVEIRGIPLSTTPFGGVEMEIFHRRRIRENAETKDWRDELSNRPTGFEMRSNQCDMPMDKNQRVKAAPPLLGGNPWERRSNEYVKAYEAFKMYADLGSRRSARRVWERLGKSRALIERWSARHQWTERAKAWDEDQDKQRRKAEDSAMKAEAVNWAKRKQQSRESDWELAESLRAKARAMLEYPIAKRTILEGDGTVHVHPQKFSLGSVARMLEVASKLSRLAAGMFTEKVERSRLDNHPVATGKVVILESPRSRTEDGLETIGSSGIGCPETVSDAFLSR